MNKPYLMMPFWRAPVFAPEDGGGPAPADGAAPAAGEGAPAAAAAGDGAPAGKWFDGDRFTPEERTYLQARGLTVDDPAEAAAKLAKMHRAAEQKLGKGPDTLLDKPAKGQSFGDWAKANAAALGLPGSVDGYKIEVPKDLPKGVAWDGALAEKATQFAFEKGVPPELHNAYVGLLADHMASIAGDLDTKQAAAKAELQGALTKEWGAQVGARTNRARQAMQMVAAEAGLTDDGMDNALAALFDTGGDPFVMKMFDAIATMMSEEKAINISGGNSPLGATPADAQNQLAAMSLPGGELYVALEAQREGKPGAAAMLDAATKKRNALTALIAGKPAA